MFNHRRLWTLLLVGAALPFTGCLSSPSLTSIVVTPNTVTVTLAPPGVPQGYTQYTAIGSYTRPGHAAETQDITNQVTWLSSDPQVATISNTGIATTTGFTSTGAWTGLTNISASAPGFNGDIVSNIVTYNVTPCTSCTTTSSEPVVSVTIVPGSQTVSVPGETGQFIALGTTGTGLQVNLTNTVGWISSDASVATINATGLATGKGQGNSTITALATNPDGSVVVGTATFTVTNATGAAPEPLQSISIIPGSQTMAAGQASQLIAIGTYNSSPTTRNLTNTVTWASSNASVATITASGGLLTAVSQGTAAITAIGANTDGSLVTATATVTVTSSSSSSEPLVSLAIVPASQTALAVNQTGHFIAIGTTGSGTTVNLTNQSATINGTTVKAAVWSSSNPAVATIDPASGIATALSAGTTAVTAIAANPDGTVVTGAAVYTVTVPSQTEAYVSLAIVPASQTVTAAGQTAEFIAIGTTGTGTTVDLTNLATWSSSSSAVATITGPGQATAVANGVAAITAEVKNPSNDGTVVTGSAVLNVSLAATTEPLLSLSIVPGSESVPAGQPTQLLALGTFSASAPTPGVQNMANVSTYKVNWYSSNPAVATVCAPPGPCSATQGTVTGTPVVVTGLAPGTTAITAIASGNPDGSVVTITTTFAVTGPAPTAVSSMSIYPGSQSVTMPPVGSPNPTINLVVIGANGSGVLNNLTSAVTWTSSNPQVLPSANIVSGPNAAVATVVDTGSTTITATYTNVATATNPVSSVVTATATVTVTGPAAEPLLSLAIVPSSPSVGFPAQTSQLTAIGTNSEAPFTENLTSTVAWSSSNPAVATVCTIGGFCPTTSKTPTTAANAGLVTAVSQGTTAITATASNPDGTLVYTTAPFTVEGGSSEQITALTIVPGSLALSATGQPGSFIALGTSGTTGLQEDVTYSPQLAWSSSNQTIATVCTQAVASIPALCPTTPGQVTGVSAGSTTITAEFFNQLATGATPAVVVTATAPVDVSVTPAAEPLLSIAVLPSSITTDNLLGTGQYLAYGTFSTAPTELEITDGFYHAGFPNSSCTDAYATADEAALAQTNPLTNPPFPECSFVPVTWVSDAPYIFPVNSAGEAGATAGLVTADGSGDADIYTVAANPDGTLVYSSPAAVFNCPYVAPTYGTTTVTNPNGTTTTTTDYNDILTIGSCNYLTVADQLVSTLTVMGTGLNVGNLPANWLITAPSATGTPSVIHCGGATEQASPGGSVCEATYPNGSVITLTAPTESGVNFGGWSSSCNSISPTPSTSTGPNTCTVLLGGGCTLNSATGTYTCSNTSNVSVVAIFN